MFTSRIGVPNPSLPPAADAPAAAVLALFDSENAPVDDNDGVAAGGGRGLFFPLGLLLGGVPDPAASTGVASKPPKALPVPVQENCSLEREIPRPPLQLSPPPLLPPCTFPSPWCRASPLPYTLGGGGEEEGKGVLRQICVS